MSWIVVGLGNPGEEYNSTRHNTGRAAVEHFAKSAGFGEFREDKKAKAHVASGVIGKSAVVALLPDTFMNKSGASLAKFVKSQKSAERMVVVYDDLDLPLGALKLSYDRGSGGHKGLESIIRAVKTKKFTRVRIGVSPTTPSGKLKKPSGEKAVIDFILTKFKSAEEKEMKKMYKRASEAVANIITEGREKATNIVNSR
ncbi:MAG: aminoacyl-tRNA hydrolase [Patescibacteria group bacterium]|nr:aminoacyl-tRNA hydrolase [Patescibacteria group bacterium]